MLNKHRFFPRGFGSQSFEIECNNQVAYDLASFLFADFPASDDTSETKQYVMICACSSRSQWSLWDGDKRLYFGTSKYRLAYTLMNEVIYHCINKNDQKHAIHAGAVWKGDKCIILPGSSGNGKSTLTAWLVTNGYHYLTDELVFISADGRISPITRPLNLKVNDTHKSWPFRNRIIGDVITDRNGSMIPHRLVNSQFSSVEPMMSHILFPQYLEGSTLKFDEISPAKSCLYLMQSHVNARNLEENWLSALSSIVKQCKSYHLTYSSFDDLETIFSSSSPPFSQ